MLYVFLYLYHFFLPGFLLYHIFRFKKFKFLLSFSLSYSLLILTLIPLTYFHASISWFTILVNTEIALLLVLLVLLTWWRQEREERNIRGFMQKAEKCFSEIVRRIRKRVGSIIIGVVLFGLILGYLLYAGPYTAVPADVWTHLWRFHAQYLWVDRGTLSTAMLLSGYNTSQWTLVDHLFRQVHHWYFIHAYICSIAGISIFQSVFPLTVATTLTFSFGIFFFGLFLFSRLRATRRAKTFTSAISVLFYIATFGVSVFVYIRYYALAATILNYVIYLTVMAIILDFIRDKTWRLKAIWLIPFFMLVMNVVHTQEALFAYFMTLAVLMVEFCRIHFGNHFGRSKASIWKINIAFIAMLGSYIALFLLSHSKPFTWYDSRFAVPVETIIPFFKNMLIQPLWQFYQVIIVWGFFVYLLFFLNVRYFKKNAFLMGGMFIPFLTVFNPVTVDMMLRLTTPDTLYRLSYCIPLPFVAAWIAMDSIQRLKKRGRVLNRMFHGVVLVGLIGLIFPVHTKYLEAPYSRIYTLQRVPIANDYKLWSDLMDFLCSLDKTNTEIITDAVTGYAIHGVTGIYCGNLRFHRTRFGWWLMSDKPAHDAARVFAGFDLNRDCLLVINERDGAPSVSGRISGHWPEDIMNVSKCYSPQMKAYVEEHPEFFKKIWENDRIVVYDIIEENVTARNK